MVKVALHRISFEHLSGQTLKLLVVPNKFVAGDSKQKANWESITLASTVTLIKPLNPRLSSPRYTQKGTTNKCFKKNHCPENDHGGRGGGGLCGGAIIREFSL